MAAAAWRPSPCKAGGRVTEQAWLDQRRASHSQTSSSGGGGPQAPASVTWVDRLLPPAAQPYAQLMRLEKPIGTWLLLWPGLWSISLAAPPGALPDPWFTGLFAVGAVVRMHSCALAPSPRHAQTHPLHLLVDCMVSAPGQPGTPPPQGTPVSGSRA